MGSNEKPMVIFLMGPTASGKTGLAMALFDRLPSEIISVDSALVYRGMDIGTAKPSRNELLKYPHHLIDIRDPAEQYSVADFCRDAEVKINHAIDRGVTPILVGGSMMYFKALLDGLASMPRTNQEIRDTILEEANEQGWPYMHQVLTKIDPEYAAQIHPNHSQRISRALEVYRASGKTMTQYRQQQADDKLSTQFVDRYNVVQIALLPQERSQLHRRIEERFNLMLDQGLIDEVTHLRNRGDLHVDLPSMRAVGYRQVWQHLNGEYDREKMIEKGIVATRQLAKRQLTWLRGWDSLNSINVNWNETQDTLKDNLEFIMNLLSTKSL